ncbi:MAG: adenylosuccinate synthetase [Enterococcus sp.]|nr:adenylosuccinate synthetase [Enterococcus sp.]
MEKHLGPHEIPIVIGLGFGDEGKGTIVDFLCQQRKTDYVIRFSGGPQTAHNVVTDTGLEHTFALFGSGTFQGAGTILTKHVLINPFNLIAEARALEEKTGENPLRKLVLSENSLLITPLHVLATKQHAMPATKAYRCLSPKKP